MKETFVTTYNQLSVAYLRKIRPYTLMVENRYTDIDEDEFSWSEQIKCGFPEIETWNKTTKILEDWAESYIEDMEAENEDNYGG